MIGELALVKAQKTLRGEAPSWEDEAVLRRGTG